MKFPLRSVHLLVGLSSLLVLGAPAQPVSVEPAVPAAAEPDQPSPIDPAVRPVAPDRRWRTYRRDVTRVGTDITVKAGETSHNVVAVWGNATVDGNVDRDLVVVGGNAKLNGHVGGNMVVVLGSVEFGPDAEIARDLVVVGSEKPAIGNPKLGGERIEVNPFEKIPMLSAGVGWLKQGLLLGRPLPLGLGWVWGVAGFLVLINILLAALFPRPVQSCVAAIEGRPIGSLFSGLLAAMLFVPVTILLVMSVIGILIVPFLFCAAVIALLLGKVAIYRHVGSQVGSQVGAAILRSPLIALLLGTAVFYLLYTIPIIGLLTWLLVSLIGVGSAIVAGAGGLRREADRNQAVAPPMPPVPPAPPAGGSGGTDPSGPPPAPGSSAVSVSAFSAPPARWEGAPLPRAGFWLRACAMVLDLILISVVTAATFHFPPVGFFLWGAYHVGMWTWKGTTIGGIVVGLKVVRTDGRPVGLSVALVRAMASIFSALVFGLGFFWAGWTREKQSWHDKIAGTIIVKVPRELALI